MSDVFVSYAREDREWVERLVGALERAGLSVWWDRRNRPGLSFDDQIEEALEAASAAIVVWSAQSLRSRWVKAEAGVALDRDILIPVLKDEVAPPLVFRQLHCANLAGWSGDAAHPEFADLLRELQRLVPPAGAADEPTRVARAADDSRPDEEETRFQPRMLQAGDVVGHYRILAPLGRGGSGATYEACNIHNEHERAALKIVRPDIPDRDRFLELLRDEANALQRVRHDAVVQYRTFGRVPDSDEFFLVIEHIDGVTLGDTIRQGALAEETVRRLARRLCDGLEAAHRQGVVHRDLTPDNVILPGGDAERAIIIDFGIARNGGFDPLEGGFAGKLSYAAPEQFADDQSEIGPWTDLYSLGLLLAAAARGGKLPMGADMAGAMAARREVPSMPGVPAGLRDALAALLEPDPLRRVRSAADAAALFAAAEPSEAGARATPPAMAAPAARSPWRSAALAAILGLGTAALGLGGALYATRQDEPPSGAGVAAADPGLAPSRGDAAEPPLSPPAAPEPVPAVLPGAPGPQPEAAPPEEPAAEPAAEPAPPLPAPPAELDARLKKIVAAARAAEKQANEAARKADKAAALARAEGAKALEAAAQGERDEKLGKDYAKKACGASPPKGYVCGSEANWGKFSGRCYPMGTCEGNPEGVLKGDDGRDDAGRFDRYLYISSGCARSAEYGTYCGNAAAPGYGVSHEPDGRVLAALWNTYTFTGPMHGDYSGAAKSAFSAYDGEWTTPNFEGHGVAAYKDGRALRGKWTASVPTSGVMSAGAGSDAVTVAAQFKKGAAVSGTIAYADGRVFAGTIDDGAGKYPPRPLEGALYAADGTILQQGKWKDGALAEPYAAP